MLWSLSIAWGADNEEDKRHWMVNQMTVTGWCLWAAEGDLLRARGCPVTRLPFPLPPKTGTKWQVPSCVTRLHFFFLSPPLPFPHTRGMSHCSRLILLFAFCLQPESLRL